MATARPLTSLRLRSCAGNHVRIQTPEGAPHGAPAHPCPRPPRVHRRGPVAARRLRQRGGSAGSDASPSTPSTTAADTIVADQPFPAARCEANKAAGKITYLSGFDFAASASIVDVFVAKQKGYFDDLCLDVEVKPSFSTTNYPLVAANAAQFSSGGSFSEVLSYGAKNDAEFRVLAVEGKTGIDTLIVKDGKAPTIDDLKGTTIGIKGALPRGVKAMLLAHGLVEGKDFQTALLDGFDPVAQMAIPGIVGLPGFKSNEPGQLARAGVKFHTFDPAAEGIPGSFGILYTNAKFLGQHPTAAVDFMRASMKGLADAIADPAGAAKIAVDDDQRPRQPELPLPRGRGLPLEHRVEARHRLDAEGATGRGGRRRAAAEGGRCLLQGRAVRFGRADRGTGRRPVRARAGLRRRRHGRSGPPA